MVYLIFRVFVALFSVFPFRIVYLISDIVFISLFYLTRYRRQVVFENLKKSFPEKDRKEISVIARRYYAHLADVLVEGVKSLTMKEQDVVSRFIIRPTADLEKFYREGRSAIFVAGHYNNWEWPGIAAGSQIMHKPVGFYKPLTNKRIDQFVKHKRVQGRSVLVSIHDTAAIFKTDWGEPAGFYMIADQSPPNPRLAYWVRFLNRDTATIFGPEKYARLYNIPVFFCDIRKIKRGYYETEFVLLSDNPSQTKTGEITARFMNILEDRIRKNPEFYLWSHRRWKHQRS